MRECGISYFAEISRILKSEMNPIVDIVLREIIKACKSESGLVKKTEPSEKKKEFSLDSDSEDDDDEGYVGVDVDVNFIDEKSAAVHALGNICLNCTEKTLEHFNDIIACLDELAFYFHENIRYHVCMTYT